MGDEGYGGYMKRKDGLERWGGVSSGPTGSTKSVLVSSGVLAT